MVDQHQSAFAGRQSELAGISGWRESDTRRTLLISGTSGVGKSALVAATFAISDPTIFHVSCRPGDRGQAPFDTLVPEVVRRLVDGGIDLADSLLVDLVPFLPRPDHGAERSVERRSLRRKFDAHRLGERPHHRAIAELFEIARGAGFATLVLEGIEHLPVAGSATLRHVVFTTSNASLDVVIAGRSQAPPHLASVLEEVRSAGLLHEIELGPLSRADSVEVATAWGVDLSADELNRRVEAAGGNPQDLLVAIGAVVDPRSVGFGEQWTSASSVVRSLVARAAVIGVAASSDRLLDDVFAIERVAAVKEATVLGWLRPAPGRRAVVVTDDDVANRIRTQLSRSELDDLSQWAAAFFADELPDDLRVLDHLRRVAAPDELAERLLALAGRAVESSSWDEVSLLLDEASHIADELPLGAHIDLAEARRRLGHEAAEETVEIAFAAAERADDHDAMIRVALLRARPGDFTSLGTVDGAAMRRLERCLALPSISRDDEARLLAAVAEELLFDSDLTARRTIASKAWRMSSQSADPDIRFTGQLAIRNALVQPEQLGDRIEAGRRLVELAELSGNEWDRAHSHLLLSGNLLERGDRDGFETRLDLAEAINRSLRSRRLDYLISTRRSAGLIMDGRYEVAEASIERDLAAATGAGFGIDYAFGLYGTQLSSIRGNQGRLGEMLGPIEYAVEQAPGFQPYTAMLAYVRAEGAVGDPAEIAEMLNALADGGFSGLRRDYFWLSTMTLIARSATLVGALDVCQLCAAELLPFSGRMAWSGTSNTGAVDWYLGGVLGSLGRFDEAERHLVASVEQYAACSMPVGTSHAQRHLAAVRNGSFTPADAEIGIWRG